MQSIDQIFVLIPIAVAAVLVLVVVLYTSRYRKFEPNEYVIWLRNGKIRKAEKGGAGFLWPLIDSIIRIPVTVQETLLEAKERVVSHEYQDLSLTAFIYWRVVNPEISFSKVSWVRAQPDYVEKVIKNAAESIIRTTCANLPIEQIIRERQDIIKVITSEMHILMADWGIIIESVEVRDVEVLDHQLKLNLEATKKFDEEQKAKLREAEMEEITRLRDLEVNRKTGLQDQEVKLAIESKAKEREIKVTELEQRRKIIEAETEQKKLVIAAKAEKEKTLAEQVDVQVERITREAEANKAQLLAQAEGEAAIIREKLVAEAQGLMDQVKALQQADERFVQLKTLEKLPEIFKGIKVDQMMVLGEGQDTYKSIAQMVLPFMGLIKQMTKSIPDGKDGDKKEQTKK